MPRPLRVCAALVPAVLALALLAGCGSDAGGDEGGTKQDSSGTTTVHITFEGDTVEPQGTKVEAEAGEPITLHITADKGGEIHVHSSPEQEIEYQAGTTEKTLTIDQPGVVDVESHDPEKLILQLEVR